MLLGVNRGFVAEGENSVFMLAQMGSQNKEEKLHRLSEFLTHLEVHLMSARDYKREYPENEDVNALIDLFKAVQEETKAVADLVDGDEDCEDDWKDLDEARESLSRALARVGHRNWIALGPTESRRFNQVFYLLQNTDDTEDLGRLSKEIGEIAYLILSGEAIAERRRTLEILVSLLSDSPETAESRTELLLRLQKLTEKLEESLDLSLFDQSLLQHKSWLGNFQHLLEAVLLGEVETRHLYEERDLALKRLAGVDGPGQSLTDHLQKLEAVLADDIQFESWNQELTEIWEQLSQSHRDTLSRHSPSCAVCSAKLEPGANRCSSCGAPVLNLEYTRMVSQRQDSGRSQLIVSLRETWTQFLVSELSLEELHSKFRAVSAQLNKAIKSTDDPSRELLHFRSTLEQFAKEDNRMKLEELWPFVLESGQTLVAERLSQRSASDS